METQPKSPREKTKQKRQRTSFRSDCDDHDGFLIGLSGRMAAFVVSSPFWGPRVAVEDQGFHHGYFARYPYRHGRDGFMSVDYEGDSSWLIRVRAGYADDFDVMSRIGGQILFDHASRFGLDTEFNHQREGFRAPVEDELWMGDANVVYRFAQSTKLQMRSGIGFNWLSDGVGSDFGFNFTYGGDWFPLNPWVVSTEIDWGRLGAAGLFHGRATIGFHYHRAEVYTGYDYLDIGNTQIDSLIAGIRFWL